MRVYTMEQCNLNRQPNSPAPATAFMPEKIDDFIPTRWSLLSRLKDWEDQDSWRQFYNTYWRLINSTALKAGLSATEAQEVVQETVISVAKKMGEFKADPAHGSFKAWLLNLTRWRITDQLRKRGPSNLSRPLHSEDTARTSTIERIADPAGIEIEEHWNKEWEKNLYHVALEHVKEIVSAEEFQIFNFLVTKQMSARAVARVLRVSLPNVYYVRYKVSSQVKKEIKRLQRQPI